MLYLFLRSSCSQSFLLTCHIPLSHLSSLSPSSPGFRLPACPGLYKTMIVCLSRQCRHYAPPTSAVRLVNLISRSPPLSKDRNALAVCHGIISPLISPSVLVLGALLHGSLLPLITCLRVYIYIYIYISPRPRPDSLITIICKKPRL